MNSHESHESQDDPQVEPEITEEGAAEVAPDSPPPVPADAAPPALAPRVVAETPLGGRPPRVRRFDGPPPFELKPAGIALPATDEQADEAEIIAAEQAAAPDAPASAAEPLPAREEALPGPPAAEPASAAAPETVPDVPVPAPEAALVRDEAPGPPQADESAGAGEWDEAISAELAAVLFGGPEQTPAPAAGAEHAAGDVPAAEPIRVIDRSGARTLPLTALSRTAPAPVLPLEGTARYTRVEEPLKGGRVQRVGERWQYLEPNRPTIGVRAVREVRIEGREYDDGSWAWRYERRYSDGGTDVRLVRASADGSYVEREDDVSQLDATTGRRQTFHEEAQLILAPPELEPKRGGFLSNLWGRDEAPDTAGERAWRLATPSESRQQRRSGGQAFRRGFLQFLGY